MDNASGSQNPLVMENVVVPREGGSNDQRFLMVFVVGTFFGPDVTHEEPRKAALERIALQLPPYTSEQLGGSVVRLAEIESIYYYILRKAHWSVRAKPQSFYKFLQGQLTTAETEAIEDDRQFTTFFPTEFHLQTRYKGAYKVVENLVFLHDPEFNYIKPEDLDRFKQLTGLTDLTLDRDEARLFRHGQRMERNEERQVRSLSFQNGGGVPAFIGESEPRKRGRPRKHPLDSQGRTVKTPVVPNALPINGGRPMPMDGGERVGPAMLMMSASPTVDQWNNIVRAARPSIAFTGTAAARQVGPLIGLVDIGVSEDAYLFRIALPGVKKDQREFSCEVECDGKVVIRGITTTGEPRVIKNSRVFYMQSQNLCPPGSFTVSFQLPGPVEPREFSGNFGSDGILEGIVMKERERANAARLTFEA